jgi:mycothiol synthase
MTIHRTLHFQERSLGTALAPLPALAGVRLRHLRAEEAGEWLALSNAAFTGHPENGGWTDADLRWRLDAAWSDLARFVVAVDAEDQLLAGVWTKVEPGSKQAELYVVAVKPSRAGQGLGLLVTLAALHALQARELSTACLYVDDANNAARRLYTTCGFTTAHMDRCFEVHIPLLPGQS